MNASQRKLEESALRLENFKSRIVQFNAKLDKSKDSLTHLDLVLDNAIDKTFSDRKDKLTVLKNKLLAIGPSTSLNNFENKLVVMHYRIGSAIDSALKSHHMRLESLSHSLAAHDKEKLLKKGFSIIRDEAGIVVSSVKQLEIGARIKVEVSDGCSAAIVD
jgi:exodeoxyribonuclease VII large subunit